jgi:peptidyl-prolyl cis-trans isomerase B (cyclophilin B)
MKSIVLFFGLGLVLLTAACSEKKNEKPPIPQADEDYLVSIRTDQGTMKAILHDDTPNHKRNFIKLIHKGFYDGLLFHRVMKDFMIQGGDPDSKTAIDGQKLGLGGPGYTVPAEIRPHLFHIKGAIASARADNLVNPHKASNGSQFYVVQGKLSKEKEIRDMKVDHKKLSELFVKWINRPENERVRQMYGQFQTEGHNDLMQSLMYKAKDSIEKTFQVELDAFVSDEAIKIYESKGGAPSLDGEYTVFGQVIDGLDIIDKIAQEEVDSSDRPKKNVSMEITFEILKREEITKRYGFQYPKK